MIGLNLQGVVSVGHVGTAQTGDGRREEGFTDVTLVDKSGTRERKGEGECGGKEVQHQGVRGQGVEDTRS